MTLRVSCAVVHGRILLAGEAAEVLLERDFARAVALRVDERDAVLEVATIDAFLPRRGHRGLHGLAELGVIFVEPREAGVALHLVREREIAVVEQARGQAVAQRLVVGLVADLMKATSFGSAIAAMVLRYQRIISAHEPHFSGA